MLRNTRTEYGIASKVLHWIVAVGMIGLIGLGAWMVDLSYFDRWYNRALGLHRSIGMVVLGFGALFAVWKLVSPSPPLQEELQPWERFWARTTHALLLAAVLVLPISGYLISTSAGTGFPFFGFAEIPALFKKSDALRDLAIAVHYYAAYGVCIVLVVHAGAAIKHQFVDKHGTLRRML